MHTSGYEAAQFAAGGVGGIRQEPPIDVAPRLRSIARQHDLLVEDEPPHCRGRFGREAARPDPSIEVALVRASFSAQ
jgi:hypothetical protein